MSLGPMVEMQADPVEDQIALGPGQHPACRVVVANPVERNQLHRTAFDGLAGGGHGHLPDIVAVVVLDRVADDVVKQLGRQHVEVVQHIHLPRAPHRCVVDLDEAVGRQLHLGHLQGPAPAGFQLGIDAFALHVLVDQLVAIRQARGELARVQVHDIDLVERAVGRLHDAEALQEHHRLVAVLAVARAGEVDRAHRARHRREIRQRKTPRERLAVEQHRHRKAQAQGLDAVAQVRQVDAVQLDPRAGDGLRDGFHLDRRLGQCCSGVDIDPLVGRGDDAARGGIEALRESDPERALLGGGGRIPARLVEAQELLEVVQAAAIVLYPQHLRSGVVIDLDPRRTGAAGVLQQLGDKRETVGESVALVAQRAFLVDSNLYLHDLLHECRRNPPSAGQARQGEGTTGQPMRPTGGVNSWPTARASIRLCPRNSQGSRC